MEHVHLETSATCGPEACTVIMQRAGTGLVCPLLFIYSFIFLPFLFLFCLVFFRFFSFFFISFIYTDE